MSKNLFFLGIIVSASGLFSPPLALAAGLIYGVSIVHPYPLDSKRLSKFLLQFSVVLLGFGMNLREVLHAGRSGFLYTAIGISCALSLGVLLGRMLGVARTQAFLIAAGTAICGGSAIAALGPVVKADDDEMAVSMGTVFILNSVALFAFPAIGWSLGLNQEQFGLWAALAIHDTSSVVGAAAKYGAVALSIAITVKLARALWIVPLAIGTAARSGSKTKVQWPWFILYFCLAAVVNSYVPLLHAACLQLNGLGHAGLAVTLFLIGTGISRKTLQQVGPRPLIQGVLLWILVATASLFAIRLGWIRL